MVGDRPEVNRLAAIALSIALALDEQRWAAARRLTDELVDAAEELRDAGADRPSEARG